MSESRCRSVCSFRRTFTDLVRSPRGSCCIPTFSLLAKFFFPVALMPTYQQPLSLPDAASPCYAASARRHKLEDVLLQPHCLSREETLSSQRLACRACWLLEHAFAADVTRLVTPHHHRSFHPTCQPSGAHTFWSPLEPPARLYLWASVSSPPDSNQRAPPPPQGFCSPKGHCSPRTLPSPTDPIPDLLLDATLTALAHHLLAHHSLLCRGRSIRRRG